MPRYQQIDNKIVPYYKKTAFSTWVLATGQSSYTPFNNVEATTLRNYNKGQNIFEMNRGRVLALSAELLDSSYATPVWTVALATAWESIRNKGVILVSQDGTTSDNVTLKEISTPAPLIVGVAAIANFDSGSPLKASSSKRACYYEPPLIVDTGRSLDFAITLIGVTVPAALNGYNIRFDLVTEELPVPSDQEVRQ